MPLLEVRGLTIRFGGIAALTDVSFCVEAGQITGLIGPNGAGKTTCFNCITRLYQPDAGEVLFHGEDLLRRAPQQIAAKRIARTFQNVCLFDRMTVLENVLVGAHAHPMPEAMARREAFEILERLNLDGIAHRAAHSLPFATRKRIELARALMVHPELLLLDEPAGGLGHEEVAALAGTIRGIARDFRTTIVMVEHHMQLVMRVCDHIIVLATGRTLTDGPPDVIQQHAGVIEAYLGAV